MKQTFTKYNAKNTNSSGRAVLRQGTLRRPDAVPPTSRSICHVRRIPAFVLLLALCCASCRNVIEVPDEPAEITESGGGTEAAGRLYTLSGAVGAGGAVPSSLAANSWSAFFSSTGGGIENAACGDADGTAIQSGRAANARSATYSSGQLAGVSYTVTATTVNSPDSNKNPPGTEKTVDATAAEDGSHRFYIELLEGTYTLSVEGFLGEGDGKKKILEGTYRNADTNNKVVIGPESSPDNCNILVHPIFGGSGTGAVNLTLSMAADCNIKRLEARWEADGTQKTKTFTDFTDDGNGFLTALFTMTADGETDSDIPAGFHHVDFYFYGDEGGTDELYSCTQYLNVFENLTTDLWRNNGATPYIGDDGNFMLTRSVIYSRKLFYVKNRNDSEKGEGTRYSPFDSVQTAVQKILAANDGASEYKIALLSDDTDASTSSYTADTSRSYICINPDKPLKLIIETDVYESSKTNGGNPFTINANRTAGKTGRVMYIGQNAEVTLNNIKITGGYASGTGGDVSTVIGGGVWVSGGTFIMESGTQISGNTADYGGGVRVNGHSLGEKGGTFIMNGGTISGNTAVNDGGGLCVCDADAITLGSGLIADNRAAAGGGIYFEGSGTDAGGTVMFRMSGTTVSGNTAAYNSESTYGGDGGGIYIDGSSVEMTACTIGGSEDAKGNSADKSGGGIYSTGKLTVSGGTIENCTASGTGTNDGGGGIYSDGRLTLTGGTVSGCTAAEYGGGIYFTASSTLKISGSATISGNKAKNGGGIAKKTHGFIEMDSGEISGNTATGSGGGIYSYSGGSVEISGGTVKENNARSGGGIYHWSAYGVTISGDAIIKKNTASGNGGGIHIRSGSLSVEGGEISGNTATDNGGGIYSTVKLTVSGGTIGGTADGDKNKANYGGGVYVTGSSTTFNMTDGTISGNTAEINGGGVYVNSGKCTMTGGTITNCTAKSSGGGIYSSGTFTMSGGTVSGNTATTYGGGSYVNKGTFTMSGTAEISGNEAVCGGGIYNQGTLTVTGGKISNCTATQSGGGIYNDVSDASITCTITGCEISGCTAPGTGSGQGGGGICNNAGTLNLTDVNITGSGDSANPDARSGGGIYNITGTLTVSGGSITNCTSLYAGGGIYNKGTLTVTGGATISTCKTKAGRGGGICSSETGALSEINCIIQSCEAISDSGGGISNETGTLTMTGGTITDCTATQNGGGIYNNVSDTSVAVKIENCEISGCKALGTNSNNGGYGGGIYNAAGTLELTSVNITGSGDETAQDARYGGGIYNKGTLTVTGGEITACVAGGGGGTYNSAGTFKISGGTISTNIARAGGGGVYIYGGTFTMSDGTISGNFSKNAGGGGVYIMGGTFTMGGGTISGNTASNNGGGVCKGRGGTFNANGGTVSGNSPDDVYSEP